MYKHQLALDRQALTAFLHQAYGLDVREFTFIQEGQVGQNYILTCHDGSRNFLKLYPHNRLAHLGVRRLDFTLTLTRMLFEKKLLTRLSYPIPSRSGALQTTFQGTPLILYPYIPGRNLMDCLPYPPPLLEQAAGLIAELHRATRRLGMAFPYVDDFTAHFEAELRKGLMVLGDRSAIQRPGQHALRRLLLPHKALVLALIDQMQLLAERVSRLPLEMVICHTDANQANLILSDSGELYLVDWEGALLAPAEHDLFIFTGEGFETFLQHYRRLRPRAHLYPEVFAFYFYRRNLEDLTDWLVRILYENTTSEQDEADLAGIEQDCISGWPYLPDAVERMRVQLA